MAILILLNPGHPPEIKTVPDVGSFFDQCRQVLHDIQGTDILEFVRSVALNKAANLPMTDRYDPRLTMVCDDSFAYKDFPLNIYASMLYEPGLIEGAVVLVYEPSPHDDVEGLTPAMASLVVANLERLGRA